MARGDGLTELGPGRASPVGSSLFPCHLPLPVIAAPVPSNPPRRDGSTAPANRRGAPARPSAGHTDRSSVAVPTPAVRWWGPGRRSATASRYRCTPRSVAARPVARNGVGGVIASGVSLSATMGIDSDSGGRRSASASGRPSVVRWLPTMTALIPPGCPAGAQVAQRDLPPAGEPQDGPRQGRGGRRRRP